MNDRLRLLILSAAPALTSPDILRQSRQSRRPDVERCLREARAYAKSQETNVQCDVLAVNPCRPEASLRCSGRAHGERVKHTTWLPIDFIEEEPLEADGGG